MNRLAGTIALGFSAILFVYTVMLFTIFTRLIDEGCSPMHSFVVAAVPSFGLVFLLTSLISLKWEMNDA